MQIDRKNSRIGNAAVVRWALVDWAGLRAFAGWARKILGLGFGQTGREGERRRGWNRKSQRKMGLEGAAVLYSTVLY